MNMPDKIAIAELPPQQNAYDYDELIRAGRGEFFGQSNGKLPAPPMLMLDRIPLITSDTGKYDRGESLIHFEYVNILNG